MERDTSCLYYIAHALMSLQSLYGTIPHVKASRASSLISGKTAAVPAQHGTHASAVPDQAASCAVAHEHQDLA